MTYKVLITGSLDPLALKILGEAKDIEVDYRPDLPYKDLLPLVGECHALVNRSETDVTRELIDKAKHLKVIARAAVGVGNIDIDYATEKGILVINTPGKNTNSAAELTLTLLLAAVRKVVSAHEHMAQLHWERHRFTGTELLGKTIGIIGLGNVGHRVARFAHGFDMEVLAYDPYISDDVFEAHQAQKVGLDTLLARADVVTLHVPKNKETTNLIGADELAKCRDGVILINTARGGVVNEQALLAALKSGKVAAAGIDTWDVEPPKENLFKELPNVVMTPHIGASTHEAQLRIAESIAEQTIRALRDEVVDFPVNMPRLKGMMTPRSKYYTVLAEKLGRFAMQSLQFNPRQITITYRGELTQEEGGFVRMGFLKGFMAGSSDEVISFVNADKKAAERAIKVVEETDPGFTVYQSAVKFTVADQNQTFTIGGVVFGENNYRLSLVNGFTFEVHPEGNMLTIVNRDQVGVIGKVGTTLAEAGVNISQFELSRNRPGGEAMAVICVDSPISKQVLDTLKALPFIIHVCAINI